MKNLLIKILPFLVITVISYFAINSLFQPGFFPIHDDEQVGRLFELNYSLVSGHFPPRLSQNLGFGYGYPIFNFYPSFVYYIAEAFVLIGFGFIASIKIMIGLGFILSGQFMYLFSKEYFGKIGGLLSAGLYIYAPYHSVDVYVRGALPEFWSFVFVPAIFWSLKKLADTNNNKYLILVSLFSSMLVLTHNLVAMMSGFFILVYVLYLSSSLKNKKSFWFKVIFSGMLALGISAYFWIPSFFERKFTMIELLTSELADYRQHFIYLKQFWNSAWGFGGSAYGPGDGMSFQIGKINIILTFVTILAVAIHFLLKIKIQKIYIVFMFLFLFSIFIQTEYSKFIWDNLSTFSYIQFPWRFMLFTVFASSFLSGGVIFFIKNRNIKIAFVVLVLFITILASYKYFKPQMFLTNRTDNNYIQPDFIKWDTSILAFEYVPYGIATKTGKYGNTVVDISRDEISKNSYEVISGEVDVKEVINLVHKKKFELIVKEPSVLQINTYSFPGWKAYLNNEEITYSDSNKLKLIHIDLEKGKYELSVVFEDTLVRKIANYVSLLSLSGLILYLIYRIIKIKR